MIDTVLLDLGNVLLLHDNALLFRLFGERAGLDASEVALRLEPLWDRMNTGALDEQQIRSWVNDALGTRLGAGEFFELFNAHFAPNAPMLAEVEPLVGRYKLGLLSNTNPVHARWFLPRLPVLKRFDAVLLSHEQRLAKPDARFYRAALDRLGARAERTIFFDDIPAYVDAARALGIRAEVFTDVTAFQRALEAAR